MEDRLGKEEMNNAVHTSVHVPLGEEELNTRDAEKEGGPYLVLPGQGFNVGERVPWVAEPGLQLGAKLLEVAGLGGDVDDPASGLHDGDEGPADLVDEG